MSMMTTVDPRRILVHRNLEFHGGLVVYRMSRDMRVSDNWALLFASQYARQHDAGLAVVFVLDFTYPFGNLRNFDFLLQGLKQTETALVQKNIPFILIDADDPFEDFYRFVTQNRVGAVVSDFDPLKYKRAWIAEINKLQNVSHFEVDAHNIVPCFQASQKQEFGAYTIRPKIQRLLPDFLTEYPELTPQDHRVADLEGKPFPRTDWDKLFAKTQSLKPVPAVSWLSPGETAARQMLDFFVERKLQLYDSFRNKPEMEAQSNLSPYLHFGQIAAQRVALEVRKAPFSESQSAFLEELIVRRELSDNFCFYNSNYDTCAGFPDWAKRDMELHRGDKRPYLYSLEELEKAQTHDPLWNAAQRELLTTGKMHGYLRMYWAKKILEWTTDPETAMADAIYLNDTYSLDGRDPNGYAGIAWSIGGVHDRAWFPRPVFGKIRYMSYSGCKSKFDIAAYISKYS